MPPLIECRDLVKNYGRIRAVDRLSFSIEAGEPVGLVGPNGAGKTTLLSLIAGFITPDRGKILIGGSEERGIGRIGILPQDAPFLKGIKVADQLVLFARLQGLDQDMARDEMRRVTSDFEVSDLVDRKPEKLSYGQRKRVALAQAILGNPQLVLLDEPTSGLDPVVADDVRRLIRLRAREITFLISSHNLSELEDICKTIIVINQGKLVISSSVAELRGQDQNFSFRLDQEVTRSVLGNISGINGVVNVMCPEEDGKQIIVEYDCEDPGRLQMDILGQMRTAGIMVESFSRGKKLSDGVVRLVRGED
ncbi:MAG: ABC transporter ATP-binding protein [Gammaproteobacteria bacterium]|nr:ABC transporter ATP-binding protein [Gammaproteobacteria bacterium]